MYIIAGGNEKKKWLDGAVDGSVCAMTESSNVNGNVVFFYWLQFFVGNIGPARPQVLILDAYFSNLTQRSVEFAVANQIKFFLQPSNTSHFLQPLDVGVFGNFKKYYATAELKFPALKGIGDAALLIRDDIPALTRTPFIDAFAKTKIRTAFFKTGIYPFDVDIMLEEMEQNQQQGGSSSSVYAHADPRCSHQWYSQPFQVIESNAAHGGEVTRFPVEKEASGSHISKVSRKWPQSSPTSRESRIWCILPVSRSDAFSGASSKS